MRRVCLRRRPGNHVPDLDPTTFLEAAAWVPDDAPRLSWEEAADLALQLTWERSDEEGTVPLIVSTTFQNGRGIRSLGDIAGRDEHATPHGKERFNAGPVSGNLYDRLAPRRSFEPERTAGLNILVVLPSLTTLSISVPINQRFSLRRRNSARFPPLSGILWESFNLESSAAGTT